MLRANFVKSVLPVVRRVSLFAGCALIASAAHAGLFDGLQNLGATAAKAFKGSAEADAKNMKRLPPDPFDFDAAAKDPQKLLAKELAVEESYGSGIKGMKKIAIASLQLRIRKELIAEVLGAPGLIMRERVRSVNVVQPEPELYQLLVDAFYDQVQADLKGLGLEVVDIAELAKQPGYQRGRTGAKENGRVVTFANNIGVGRRDALDSDGRSSSATAFGKLADTFKGYPYYVFYATKTPELMYSSQTLDATGSLSSTDERIVEPGPISTALLESAKNAGVGLLTLGVELRYGKFDRLQKEATFTDYQFVQPTLKTMQNGTAFKVDSKTTNTVYVAKVAFTPMVRSQLIALKVTPEGAERSAIGNPNNMRVTNGVTVIPGSERSASCSKLICQDKDYRWIESIGEGYETLFQMTPGQGADGAEQNNIYRQ